MALVSVVGSHELGRGERLDAEYYSPLVLQALERVGSAQSLRSLDYAAIHPREVKREYVDEGLRVLLAQNVRDGYLDLAYSAFFDTDRAGEIDRNEVLLNDVLVTRTGANAGQVAGYFGETEALYACADVLLVRGGGLPAGYLSAYLASAIGRLFVERAIYGAGQPHVAPSVLLDVPVPRLGRTRENEIDGLIREAYRLRRSAAPRFRNAESRLSEAIGEHSREPTDRFFAAPVTQAFESGRLDPEFHTPSVRHFIRALSRDGTTIGDFVAVAETSPPSDDGTVLYAEIGDIDSYGRVDPSHIPFNALPSRAKWSVESNDVLVSTVRPLRRLVGVVSSTQRDLIASSGFLALTPTTIPPELLLAFLRNESVAQILHLKASASMYPAVSYADILDLPMPLVSDQTTVAIADQVRQAWASLDKARQARSQADSLIRESLGE